jgi:hypothetical protein
MLLLALCFIFVVIAATRPGRRKLFRADIPARGTLHRASR